ncbi:MAG: 6-phosphogluconolactonase [Bacteroidia bacterium]|nr:6-phosphogluconolactonase [Bacteroidia bacterium]
MKIIPCSDYDEMSQLAAQSVLTELRQKSGQLLCPASGNSAVGVYNKLAHAIHEDPQIFEELRILMLDEWHGLAADDPNSCNAFLNKYLVRPLAISKERCFFFDGNTSEPEKECERMVALLSQQGPIDVCILGMGINGHLGFNEPAASLSPHCHLSKLSETSKKHAMICSMRSPPEFGITLGMEDILQSKKIILLLSGKSKQEVIEKLLSKEISPQLPASFLWQHPNVECYLDRFAIIE